MIRLQSKDLKNLIPGNGVPELQGWHKLLGLSKFADLNSMSRIFEILSVNICSFVDKIETRQNYFRFPKVGFGQRLFGRRVPGKRYGQRQDGDGGPRHGRGEVRPFHVDSPKNGLILK